MPIWTGVSVLPRAAPADSKSMAVKRQWRTSGMVRRSMSATGIDEASRETGALRVKTKKPGSPVKAAGLAKPELLGGHRSWCWRRCGAWAARSGEEGRGGRDDKEFNDVHVIFGCWFLRHPRVDHRMTQKNYQF